MSATTIKKIKKTANSVSNLPSNNSKRHLTLDEISPLTEVQRDTFDAFKKGYNLALKGSAGTGKTFLALYLALRAISNNLVDQSKIVIIRSVVPTRDIGALPGDVEEKIGIYEIAYCSILTELTGNKNAYSAAKSDGLITFVPTSYLRGVTFRDSIIILDEGQSCNYHELSTVITRTGENCRFIFCGDIKQNDLIRKSNDVSGFNKFMDVISEMSSFKTIEFGHDDIVRGDVCREFIIKSEMLGY